MNHRIRPLVTMLAVTATVAGGGAAIASAATSSSSATTTSKTTAPSTSTGASKTAPARPGPMGAHRPGSSKNCPNM